MNHFNATGEYRFERTGKSVIGHIYSVRPREVERYYARMLHPLVTSTRSFQSLRNVDGEVHESYRDACLIFGLLSSNME